MVEIIPYTEDDDDRSNWIPLHSSTSPSSSGGNRNNVATMIPSHHATSATVTIDESHNEDIVFVERNVVIDDIFDDDGWQELSPPSTSRISPPPPNNASGMDGIDDGGGSPASSWGRRMMSRLASASSSSPPSSSTTATPPVNASSTSGGKYDDGIDDGIVWRGADQLLDDDGTDMRTMQVGGGGTGGGAGGGRGRRRPSPGMEEKGEGEGKENGTGGARYPSRRGRVDDGGSSSTTSLAGVGGGGGTGCRAESMLRKTLISDPLLSLPASFLRHFCREVANRLFSLRASSSMSTSSEAVPLAAPMTLIAMIALMGLTFVVTGLIGVVNFVVRASASAAGSVCAWLFGLMIDVATKYAVRSMFVVVLLLVGIARIRRGGRTTSGEGEDERSMPYSISDILPWTVAIASPSSIEALVVVLSLLSFSSILIPSDDDATGECSTTHGIDDDGGRYCSNDVGSHEPAPSYRGISSPAVATVALLVAAINVLVVSMAANELDRRCRNREVISTVDSGRFDLSTYSSPAEIPDDTSSASSLYARHAGVAMSRLHTSYNCILRHVRACHTVYILALAVLSTSFVLVRALYAYFRRDGMNVIFAMGTVSFHIVHVGLGVVIIVSLWNRSIAEASENDAISCGQISRHALKKSVMEISSNAVWSMDDTCSSLLGILSNDDGALRYAILEWIVDRWTASALPHDAVPSEHVVSQSGYEPILAEAMGGGEYCSKDEPTSKSFHDGNHPSSDPNFTFSRIARNTTSTATTNENAGDNQTSIPSYHSLHRAIAKLDADETLIPTIERYREWVYSLPPTRNAAMCVALWKMCPATSVFAVALLWYVGWSFVGGLLSCFLSCVRTPSQIASTTNDGVCKILCLILTVLSPVMLLEYHRVQIWWTRTANYVRSIKYDTQSSDSQNLRRDLTMNLMRADIGESASQPVLTANFLFDTSSLLLHIWILLIESISVLEASVPVVRCATVTCAAADFTANSMSLVDMAQEVKRRGLLCGVGMIAWDAFCYHLSNELEQRKKEADGTRSTDEAREEQSGDSEVLGGQYTYAAVKAVSAIEKLSRNLSCLMVKKRSDHDNNGKSDGGDDGHLRDEPTIRVGIAPPNCNYSQDDGHEREIPSHDESNQDDPSSFKQEGDFYDDSGDHQHNNGSLPFLIGGGIALAGAVAGLAMHAATSNGKQTKKDPEKDSRKI